MPAASMPASASGIPTGMASLDKLLGSDGVPPQAITVLSGSSTCGKLTLAYKTLAQAQHGNRPVAILDLNASTDADYLARCGVDLDNLLLVRPSSGAQAARVLLDLVKSRALRAILVDSLTNHFDRLIPQINLALKGTGCALIFLDESEPPWLPPAGGGGSYRILGHYAALHVELARDGWIEADGELSGYRARARVVKRRGPGRGQSAVIAIEFGETVHARETW